MGYIIMAIVGLAYYIVVSLQLYKMAKQDNLSYAYFAWLPIGWGYILGGLGNEPIVQRGILGLNLASRFIDMINSDVLSILVLIADILLHIRGFHSLFKKRLPENAILYTVIAMIPLATPFVLLIATKQGE